MKQTGDISLIKEDQKKFTKKTQKLKQKIKDGKVVIRQKPRLRRRKISKPGGLIYIGHLPHGFYEDEIKAYFSQFGRVLNVKVCRSRRTGNSKGYGFVEFEHEDVAKIAAETMNNYLMFKKKLVANFIPNDKRPPHIFHSVQSTSDDYSTLRRRRRLIALEFKETDNDKHLKQCKAKLKKLGKRLKKLKELGINHEVQPVDVPEGLEIKKIE